MSEKPRKIAELIVDDEIIHTYQCFAPESIIDTAWDDIPEEHQKIIAKLNGLNCEGGGVPGSCGWCHYSMPHGYNAPKEKD